MATDAVLPCCTFSSAGVAAAKNGGETQRQRELKFDIFQVDLKCLFVNVMLYKVRGLNRTPGGTELASLQYICLEASIVCGHDLRNQSSLVALRCSAPPLCLSTGRVAGSTP